MVLDEVLGDEPSETSGPTGDQHGAARTDRACSLARFDSIRNHPTEPRDEVSSLANRHLGLARSDRCAQPRMVVGTIEVDEDDRAIRVFRLRRANQAPDGRVAEIERVVADARRDRATRDDHESLRDRGVRGEPRLHLREHGGRCLDRARLYALRRHARQDQRRRVHIDRLCRR